MEHSEYDPVAKNRRPWNVGRMIGAKRPLKPQQVWAIRFWLRAPCRFCSATRKSRARFAIWAST